MPGHMHCRVIADAHSIDSAGFSTVDHDADSHNASTSDTSSARGTSQHGRPIDSEDSEGDLPSARRPAVATETIRVGPKHRGGRGEETVEWRRAAGADEEEEEEEADSKHHGLFRAGLVRITSWFTGHRGKRGKGRRATVSGTRGGRAGPSSGGSGREASGEEQRRWTDEPRERRETTDTGAVEREVREMMDDRGMRQYGLTWDMGTGERENTAVLQE